MRDGRRLVNSVLDRDMERFLTGIGELERVRSGSVSCKICSTTITVDKVQFVIPDGLTVTYVCQQPSCAVTFATEH